LIFTPTPPAAELILSISLLIFSIIQLIPLAIVDLIPFQAHSIADLSPFVNQVHIHAIILSPSVKRSFIPFHISVTTHLIQVHHTVTIVLRASQKRPNVSFILVMNCLNIHSRTVKAPENTSFIHSHTQNNIVFIASHAQDQFPVSTSRNTVNNQTTTLNQI